MRRRVEAGLLGQRDTLGDAASTFGRLAFECVAPGHVAERLASLGQPAEPACELQLLGRRGFGRIEPAGRELDAEQARKREPKVSEGSLRPCVASRGSRDLPSTGELTGRVEGFDEHEPRFPVGVDLRRAIAGLGELGGTFARRR